MSWLNEELKLQIRKLFEPRYKRKLDEEEVVFIATNLTELLENTIKFKIKKYEKCKQAI